MGLASEQDLGNSEIPAACIYVGWALNTFLQSFRRIQTAEYDGEFKYVLTALARRGMRVGAVLGITAAVLFVVFKLLLGSTPALWDKLIITGLGISAFSLAPRLNLSAARLLACLIAIACGAVSTLDDVMASDISFSTAYLTFIFVLVGIAIPFRPGQLFGLGCALVATHFFLIELAPTVRPRAGDYVYLALFVPVFTGAGWLIYIGRLSQYEARREADRLREEVELLERTRSRFFENISHEFRNPLQLIVGPVGDAIDGRYGEIPPNLSRQMSIALTQADRMRRLTDQLLDLARLDAGRMPLHAQEEDLVEFVRRQVGLFQSHATLRQIRLSFDSADSELSVWFDPRRLEEVMANLLSNAVKFTPPQGSIRVKVQLTKSRSSDYASISVRNSGQGIPPEEIDAIWNRFTGHGTGIGLALVKELVERHGGFVSASSDYGFWTELKVLLRIGRNHLDESDRQPEHDRPARDHPADHLPRLNRTETVPDVLGEDLDPTTEGFESNGLPVVVLVEDDDSVRDYLRDLLRLRYRVIEFADVLRAIRWLEDDDCSPALVISDIMLSEVNGLDLCRHVKSSENLSHVPVILLTALTEHEARLEGLKSGADAYLAKPVRSDVLLVVAENLVEVRRAILEDSERPLGLAPLDELPSHEDELRQKALRVANEHIGNSQFTVDWFADEMSYSKRQLSRLIQRLFNKTPAVLVKTLRFQRARQFVRETDLQIQEIANAVGYEDANYFSREYRLIHGSTPTEERKSHVRSREAEV